MEAGGFAMEGLGALITKAYVGRVEPCGAISLKPYPDNCCAGAIAESSSPARADSLTSPIPSLPPTLRNVGW